MLTPPIREGVLLATAEAGPSQIWLYTSVKPGAGWTAPQFEDRQWDRGQAVFGKEGTPNIRIGTLWNTREIWLRTSVDFPQLLPNHVIMLRLRHDDDVEIYVNGELLVRYPGWNNEYSDIPLNDAQKARFVKGRNTLAVYCFANPCARWSSDRHGVNASEEIKIREPQRAEPPLGSLLAAPTGPGFYLTSSPGACSAAGDGPASRISCTRRHSFHHRNL